MLYLRNTPLRLALKLFRGEPAIAEFDWPFTPIHSSSKDFSTSTGSALGLRPLVGIRFQVLFHSLLRVLFTFPSRYYALSVTWEYLALSRGRNRFAWNSTCSMLLGRRAARTPHLKYRAVTFYGYSFQNILLSDVFLTCWCVCCHTMLFPTTPVIQLQQD
ncbi:MAG: hypothetical protein XE04_0694 [Marinimicrobia bacterium 46_43]|nr:MAG: hypothetical protein XE04_0694 [Marinimicrobia bacterium 46_43]